MDKHSIIVNLAHEVEMACLYENVDKFCNIDGIQLVKKLEEMPTYFYFAIVDALEEWRFNTMYTDTPSNRSIYSYFQDVSKKDAEVYL